MAKLSGVVRTSRPWMIGTQVAAFGALALVLVLFRYFELAAVVVASCAILIRFGWRRWWVRVVVAGAVCLGIIAAGLSLSCVMSFPGGCI